FKNVAAGRVQFLASGRSLPYPETFAGRHRVGDIFPVAVPVPPDREMAPPVVLAAEFLEFGFAHPTDAVVRRGWVDNAIQSLAGWDDYVTGVMERLIGAGGGLVWRCIRYIRPGCLGGRLRHWRKFQLPSLVHPSRLRD